MNVANKELCQKLYELSGWGYEENRTSFVYLQGSVRPYLTHSDPNVPEYHKYEDKLICPAYDLGYLLRKLPEPTIYLDTERDEWVAQTDVLSRPRSEWGDTPEDACALLAIELFEKGILRKDKSE